MLTTISRVFFCGASQRPLVCPGSLAIIAVVAIAFVVPVHRASAQDEVYEEEAVEIITGDGVKLKASYYAGADYQSVPIVILHGFKEDRSKYIELAEFLQGKGHTVLIPDLRGHGESTQTTLVDRRDRPITLNTKGMSAAHIRKMITHDMAAIKEFLVERNNAEELNIRKMCILGAEMGAVVALNYAAEDWLYKDRGLERQGQDVRGIILLSPPMVFKRVAIKKAMASITKNDKISVLTLVGGKDKKMAAFASQVHKMLSIAKVRQKEKSLFLKRFDTELQGRQLLGNEELSTEALIQGFTNRQVVGQKGKDVTWKKT